MKIWYKYDMDKEKFEGMETPTEGKGRVTAFKEKYKDLILI